MNRIKIITPDPIVEVLLTLLAEQLPESNDHIVLLDAAQIGRISEFSGARIILFTASADPAYLAAARESGADGFWYLKPSVEELSHILEGDPAFPEKAPAVSLGNALSSALTKRELEVLREMVAGKTDAEIGEALNMAVPTVKHHIQQLFFKTGFANRTQLAVDAVRSRLIRK